MTQMTVVDVVKIKFPKEFEAGNIAFGMGLDKNIFITHWNVSGVPEPTISELEKLIPAYKYQFDLNYFVNNGTKLIEKHVESVAQQKQYTDALSCVSYINSTIDLWKSEALEFIKWRDEVYKYLIEQIELIQKGQRTIPNFEDFKNELPVITWP